MPAGGDDFNTKRAERKEKEAERKNKAEQDKKKAAPTVVKSIGRVGAPSTPGPRRPICEAARDARARNSPAAPNLEAQCRASQQP